MFVASNFINVNNGRHALNKTVTQNVKIILLNTFYIYTKHYNITQNYKHIHSTRQNKWLILFLCGAAASPGHDHSKAQMDQIQTVHCRFVAWSNKGLQTKM